MRLSLALFPTTHKVVCTLLGSNFRRCLALLHESFSRLEILSVVFVRVVVAACGRRAVLRRQPILPHTVQLA